MSRVEDLWERLVRAALRRERTGTETYGVPSSGIAGYVPSSLAKNRDIDAILRAADEIQDEDPNVSRILCEHAYSLSQNLDPNSEGRGVLQFKTGLMSVIKALTRKSRKNMLLSNEVCIPQIVLKGVDGYDSLPVATRAWDYEVHLYDKKLKNDC